MFKEAALVGVGVLGATGALLWITPAPTNQAAAAVSLPLRGFAPAERAPVVTVTSPAQKAAIAASPASRVSAVRKGADGHFWAESTTNGRHVRFLVDTGATTVALTAEDAVRLGVDIEALDYDIPVQTAAGETQAASVKLDYVSIGGARVNGVEAVVVREGLTDSLLGMSYLGRLSRFEATQSALILRP
jgi:aspartyl protease family protein